MSPILYCHILDYMEPCQSFIGHYIDIYRFRSYIAIHCPVTFADAFVGFIPNILGAISVSLLPWNNNLYGLRARILFSILIALFPLSCRCRKDKFCPFPLIVDERHRWAYETNHYTLCAYCVGKRCCCWTLHVASQVFT